MARIVINTDNREACISAILALMSLIDAGEEPNKVSCSCGSDWLSKDLLGVCSKCGATICDHCKTTPDIQIVISDFAEHFADYSYDVRGGDFCESCWTDIVNEVDEFVEDISNAVIGDSEEDES